MAGNKEASIGSAIAVSGNDPSRPFRGQPISPAQRWLSLAELAIGSAIVIGHNVYHVIPNEVPTLFVLGLLSGRLRDGSWRALGFRWPVAWKKTVLWALAAAALRILLGALVVDPLTAHFWPPAVAPSGMNEITGHWKTALQWVGLVWTFAAFGEEISYRGYLLRRAADAGGRSKLAWWVGVLIVAVLFGYGHYYKGPAGIIDSGVAGLILAAAYVLSEGNLWVCLLAHGFIDTFGVIMVFFGWAS
ncbi:MAG TPA: CPBP family intramembrane glutamic endopeptidase [Terriglobales bacterium]|nr:CPBP family intramembrane glutamic endopeptidase [Terriglobales bacterium]